MEHYRNSRGGSPVIGYEIGTDYITVEFRDGALYCYTYDSAGAMNVERMKRLARTGQGLGIFLRTAVNKSYARKEK